jgi:ElaB/YqjD/DUF883 family membrane-anchored ribosome-binding protein
VLAASSEDATLDLLHDWARQKYQQMRQRERKRLRRKRGARAHRGDRNRAAMCADTADSDKQIRIAWWCSGGVLM